MAKTLDQMLDELLTLYPGTDWRIEIRRTQDQGGTLVPSVCAMLGRYGISDAFDDFPPIYIDDKGEDVDSDDFEKYYEVGDAFIDSTVEDVVRSIYDEVMKRIQNGNQNRFCPGVSRRGPRSCRNDRETPDFEGSLGVPF